MHSIPWATIIYSSNYFRSLHLCVKNSVNNTEKDQKNKNITINNIRKQLLCIIYSIYIQVYVRLGHDEKVICIYLCLKKSNDGQISTHGNSTADSWQQQ